MNIRHKAAITVYLSAAMLEPPVEGRHQITAKNSPQSAALLMMH